MLLGDSRLALGTHTSQGLPPQPGLASSWSILTPLSTAAPAFAIKGTMADSFLAVSGMSLAVACTKNLRE